MLLDVLFESGEGLSELVEAIETVHQMRFILER